MNRRALTAPLALGLALAAPAPALAATDAHTLREAHRHPGFLFQIRFEPELNTEFVYRVFRAGPDTSAGLLVERSDGYLGDTGFVDLNPAACPGVARQAAALANMPMPAPAIAPARSSRYDTAADPRDERYTFNGFIGFPNGGEGEISFMSYDVPGHATDPQLQWMRELVRAFDACRPRRPQRD